MFLSIIIPVYNVEKYLAECLDSCLNQDIPAEEYEIICVNDGSPDGCAGILEEYQKKHSNIRVFYQENAGLSAARNTGIAAARGDYLWFVDSDDFIQENVLGRLVEIRAHTAADRISFRHYEFEERLNAGEQAARKAQSLRPKDAPSGNLLCESLFKRSFLEEHHLRFLPGVAYVEDGLFAFEFAHCGPVTESHDILVYFYRRNNRSITRTRSQAAQQKRDSAVCAMLRIVYDYTRRDLEDLKAKNASGDTFTAVLMPSVRMIAVNAAKLPAPMRREIISLLSQSGLFPLFLYRKFRDWFPKKVHINHTYMGIKGYILDVMYFYATTRWGFALLVLYYKLRQRR